MRWWMHWGMQYLLAKTPGGEQVHRILQEKVGQLKSLETGNQFDNAIKILGLANRHAGNLQRKRVVEIGTGWVPAVPVALALAGCEVHTFDVAPLTKPEYLRRTLDAWEKRLVDLAEAAGQSICEVTERWEKLARMPDLASLCYATGGVALAPCDTANLPNETESYDLAVSNLVMQCVPESLVVPVIRESVRLLKPSGWAIHRMHLTDEYAQKDAQRHDLDFLKHPKETWDRWYNHALKVQNRWRASQFLQVFTESGLVPVEVIQRCRQSDLDYIRKLNLAPEYRDFTELDLASIALTTALQKPPVSRQQPLQFQLLPTPADGGLAEDDPLRREFESRKPETDSVSCVRPQKAVGEMQLTQ